MAKSKRNLKNIWNRTKSGTWLSGAFFARHWIALTVTVMMVLVYITNSYSSKSAMEEVRRLERRLAVVQTESYRVRGAYMGRIRESALREKVRESGLELSVQNQPPYVITETNNN